MPGFTGVSHGQWAAASPPDPPSGDYDAILIADQAAWRITSVSQTWEQLPAETLAVRVTSPPTLPAVWYTWLGWDQSADDLVKTTDNGTSWASLASKPFDPSGEAGGEYVAWADHLTAATDGILLAAKWTSTGTTGSLRLKNIYYTTDDGASWSQVYASDLANGNTAAVYGRENLVVNTVYTWYVGTGADEVIRIAHGGGLASETTIPLGGSFINAEMLACDSTLTGIRAYAVVRKSGETKRYIVRISDTTVLDVTPSWGLDDADLGNVWIAVAGDTIMALAYGWNGTQDSGSIWRSLDAGVSWSMVRAWNNDLNTLASFAGRKAVAVSPNRPQTWFLWANNSEAQGSKVMRSTDGGATWAFVNLPSADPGGDDDQHYHEIRVLG
jgi:hypothetical protein